LAHCSIYGYTLTVPSQSVAQSAARRIVAAWRSIAARARTTVPIVRTLSGHDALNLIVALL
jgi:hypothetical protein